MITAKMATPAEEQAYQAYRTDKAIDETLELLKDDSWLKDIAEPMTARQLLEAGWAWRQERVSYYNLDALGALNSILAYMESILEKEGK